MQNEGNRKRRFMTPVEAQAFIEAEVTREAMDKERLEAIVKYTYLAKNKRANTKELVGFTPLKIVEYNNKRFYIIASVSEEDVKSFKDSPLYSYA